MIKDKRKDGTVVLSGLTLNDILLATHPIGCVYTSIDNTDPSLLFGGVWARFGAGRVPVGWDSTQTEFDTVEETGGEKTHLLTANESGLRGHGHTGSSGSNSASHIHSFGFESSSNAPTSGASWVVKDIDGQTAGAGTNFTATTGGQSANHTHAITVNAVAAANAVDDHNNLQPYVVVYMWKRTA